MQFNKIVDPAGANTAGHCMGAGAIAKDNSQDTFNAKIIKQTVASVAIDWNLIQHADVYEIEKYTKSHDDESGWNWITVAWSSTSPATINNLDENFAYRFRIKALKFNADAQAYMQLQCSSDIVGATLTALPTTLCLQRAIKKGQQFLVKRLLRRRPSLIECPGPNGYMPLANAITFGEHCIIDVLLTAGASVHVGNPSNQRTPLHLAFFYGRLSVARMLLNRKADMEARDANGMTACHFAVDANQVEILRFALENGADVEANDACGWTLLLRAVVMQADLTLLKLLIMHGANRAAVDKLGHSCIDLARYYNNEMATNYFSKLLSRQGDK